MKKKINKIRRKRRSKLQKIKVSRTHLQIKSVDRSGIKNYDKEIYIVCHNDIHIQSYDMMTMSHVHLIDEKFLANYLIVPNKKICVSIHSSVNIHAHTFYKSLDFSFRSFLITSNKTIWNKKNFF